MARDFTQNAHINLSLNAKEASRVLDQETKRAQNLRKQIDALKNSGGDPAKIKALNKELKNSEALIKQLKTESLQASEVLARLDKASPKELKKTLSSLQRELNKIERGSAAWDAQMEKIRRVKAEINAVNASMREQQSLAQRLNDAFNKFAGSIAAGAAALAGLVIAGKKAVNEFAQMDEAMANTRKFTGMTVEQVEDLNLEFKNMDTRTAREKLNELAQEAGRLGKTSKEDIMGYVKAADILNVALSDLGDGATGKIAKLSNIFGTEGEYGTYDAMLKIGSAVNVLSQNCTATKPYLVEFTNRLAGVGTQANISVQDIIGLGAVLDSNGQKVEASATAIAQVLTRMYVDPAKYARSAGLDVKNFTELLKTDANEALLQFLEALNRAGNMDVLAPMFKDMGESGARAIAAMSTLAKHIDEVRIQQKNSNLAFQEGNSVLHEFEIFNNTAQASLDKAKKSVSELTVELGQKLMPVMKYFHSSSRMTLEFLSRAVDFFLKYGSRLAYLTSIILSYVAASKLANNWTRIWAASNEFFTVGLKKAAAALKAFFLTLKSNPVGMITAAVTALAGALLLLKSRTSEAKAEFDRWKASLTDLSKQTDELSKKELNAAEKLYKTAINEAVARNKRFEAAKKLIELYPAIFANMSEEDIMLQRAKKAYDNLTESIAKNARAKAAAAKAEEIQGEKLNLDIEVQDLEDQRELLIAMRDDHLDKAEFYRRKKEEQGFSLFNQYGKFEAEEKRQAKELDKKIRDLTDKIRIAFMKQQAAEQAYAQLMKVADIGDVDSSGDDDDGNDDNTNSPFSAGLSDKELKAALKKAKEAFKQGLKDVKAEEEKALNEALLLYRSGQIVYLDYIDRKKEAELKFFDDSLAFYEANFKNIKGYDAEEDADYQKLIQKRLETEQKYQSQRLSFSADRIRRASQLEQQEARDEFNWKEKKSIVDEIALQEQLLAIKIKYWQQEQELYNVGSKEWEALQLKIEREQEDARFNQQKAFAEAVRNFRKQYLQKNIQDQYQLEREALFQLRELGYLGLREFEVMMAHLDEAEKKALANRKQALPGFAGAQSKADKNIAASAMFDSQKKELDEALDAGLISVEEHSKLVAQCQKELVGVWTEGLKQCGSEWVSLFTSMGEAWFNFFDDLEQGFSLGSLEKAIGASVAVMQAAIQTVTQFQEAELKIQTAEIEKKYEREVSLAQGNSRLVSSLEKKKEEDIAKVKSEAAKKNFAMQVLIAIAQTAQNAVAAYGSAAAIPVVGHILAPIAASMAVAAGMVQVATIRKQQQAAEASGYAEGGYTPKGDKYSPAGIVHAGEWVASQKLVNNPVTAPVIELLDRAQRSNSVAAFSLAESDYFAGAASYGARASQPAPQVVVNVPQSDDKSADVKALAVAISLLVARLNQPFVTVNTMTGDHGIEKAQNDLSRYKRNRKLLK